MCSKCPASPPFPFRVSSPPNKPPTEFHAQQTARPPPSDLPQTGFFFCPTRVLVWPVRVVVPFHVTRTVPYPAGRRGTQLHVTQCRPSFSLLPLSSVAWPRKEVGGWVSPQHFRVGWLVGAILFPSHFLFWGHELLLLAERVDTVPTGPFIFQHVLC